MYINNMAQVIPWGVNKIRANEVHVTGNYGTGIKIAIIDSGIDYTHPDLIGNYKGGYNFVANTTDPFDDFGRGTHMAGTIAAIDNTIGTLGVAPGAWIYALKVLNNLGSGTITNIIAAINWCIINGMKIIVIGSNSATFSQPYYDVCALAYNNGILIINGVGNNGPLVDVTYPALFDNVIAVSATTNVDGISTFANAGLKVEISAPGVAVSSTVPTGTCKYCDPLGYTNVDGTQMAASFVAGAAALIWKANTTLTNTIVRRLLSDYAVNLGTVGRNIYYGWGRIDVKASIDNINSAPIQRYTCSGSPNFQCTVDINGIYSQVQCKSQCSICPGLVSSLKIP